MIARNQPFLWFDGNAEEAARHYAENFPDTRIDAITRAPGNCSAHKQGDVLAVEMTIFGMPFVLLNREPKFDQAISVQIATDHQAGADHYWNAATHNGSAGIAAICPGRSHQGS